MISLVVDTSTPKLVFSIVRDNRILYSFSSKVKTDLSSDFMRIVDTAFKECVLTPNDVDKVFVSLGPGSFTGIRIGLTFSKVFCFSLKKDLIPFSTLEAFASSSNVPAISLIDARRGYVFAGIYDADLNVIEKDKYVKLDDLISQTEKYGPIVFYSYDCFEKINIVRPNIDVLKIVNKHMNDASIDPHELKPMYLKDTEAEEKLKNDSKN